MPRGVRSKSKEETTINVNTEKEGSFWDIFKFGESYTSLILGIIVVVVATVLLLTFVRGKSVNTDDANRQSIAEEAHQKEQDILATSDKKITSENTADNNEAMADQEIKGSSYTIQDGDTLWSIAERKYKSGYNWIDIKEANKMGEADVLIVGKKITLPDVKAKIVTVTEGSNQEIAKVTEEPKQEIAKADNETEVKAEATSSVDSNNKITGNSYTVVRGDNLWDIAVRAYGDGYQWTKIARSNNLSNPDIIHAGNQFTIPRE